MSNKSLIATWEIVAVAILVMTLAGFGSATELIHDTQTEFASGALYQTALEGTEITPEIRLDSYTAFSWYFEDDDIGTWAYVKNGSCVAEENPSGQIHLLAVYTGGAENYALASRGDASIPNQFIAEFRVMFDQLGESGVVDPYAVQPFGACQRFDMVNSFAGLRVDVYADRFVSFTMNGTADYPTNNYFDITTITGQWYTIRFEVDFTDPAGAVQVYRDDTWIGELTSSTDNSATQLVRVLAYARPAATGTVETHFDYVKLGTETTELYSTGTYTSDILDLGNVASLGLLSWTEEAASPYPWAAWEKYAGNPVTSGLIENILHDIDDPLQQPIQYDGKYWVCYATGGSPGYIRLAYSTDPDLLVWTDYEANPVLSPTGGESYVFSPHMFKDGSTYYLVYDVSVGGTQRNAYATASAPTGPYTKGQIILDIGAPGEWDDLRVTEPYIFKEGGTYFMYYMGDHGCSGCAEQIGLATTTAALFPLGPEPGGLWTKHGLVLPHDPDPSGWDRGLTADPSIIKVGDTYYMRYTGSYANEHWQLGCAWADDPYGPWTRPDGPEITLGPPGAWDDDRLVRGAIHYHNGSYISPYTGCCGYQGGMATASLIASENLITFETRTSPDGSAWEAWQPAVNGGSIQSTPNTYFQYRSTFSASAGLSPTLTSVTIAYTEVPAVPELLNPPDAAVLSDDMPTFEWSATAGPGGSYTLQYATDPTFTTATTVTGIATNSYTVPVALPDDTYYWHVEAFNVDAAPSGYQATPFSFTVEAESNPQPVVTLLSPADLATTTSPYMDLSADVSGTDPATAWIYGGTASPPTDLLFVRENITTTQTLTYNWHDLRLGSAAYTMGLWHLDDGLGTSVADASGNGNMGTLTGGATWTQSGRFAYGLELDGTSGYVSVPDAASLDIDSATGAITMEAWVYPDIMAGGYRTIMGKRADPTHINYQISVDATNHLLFYSGHWPDIWVSDIVLPVGEWSYVAVTLDAADGTVHFYRNGVEGTPQTGAYFGPANDAPLLIGQRGGSGEYVDGRIDEVRISSLALSAAEIAANYGLADGTYYWQVKADDGITTPTESAIRSFTIAPDSDPPVITLNSPADAAVTASPAMTLDVTPSDASTPMTVWIYGDTQTDPATLLYVDNDVADLENITFDWSASVPQPEAPYTMGLWQFDEGTGTTAADGSANGNDGTLNGGATWTYAGRFGYALELDGTNDYVSIPDDLGGSLDIDSATGAITIEMWANPDIIAGGYRTLLGKYATGSQINYQISVDATNHLLFYSGKFSLGGIWVSDIVLPVDEWSYIAVTFDASDEIVHFYRNGVEGTPQSGAYLGPANDAPLYIGQNGATSEFFDGQIDAARVTDRALSAGEIAANYELGDGTYNWKVTARDAVSNSATEGPRGFTVDTSPPDLPTLTAPADAAVIADNTPTFDWSATAGSGGSYTLEYATDAGFTTDLVTVTGLATNTHTVPGALLDNTYYWHVKAIDAATNESGYQTTPFSFTVNTSGPTVPALISPSDAAQLNDDTPTFDWSATAGGGGTYTLEYATDAGFTTDLVTVTGLATNTHTVPGALLDNTYYWHVKAIDAATNESGYQTTPFSFTVDTSPPDVPTLTSPADASVTSDDTPTFDWSATAGGGGIYTLEYATDAGFTTDLVTVTDIATNSYTVSGALPANTYYWHVKAIDAATNESGYQTTPFSFTVSTSSGSPVVTLNSPPDAFTTSDTSVVLSASVSDPDSDPMTVTFYCDDVDASLPTYVQDDVASGSTLNYTFTRLALQPDLSTIGLWHFDEGSGGVLHDASGNGQDGYWHCDSTLEEMWDTDGPFGHAVHFSGLRTPTLDNPCAADYVEVPDHPGLDVAPGEALSIEFWVNPDVLPTSRYWGLVGKRIPCLGGDTLSCGTAANYEVFFNYPTQTLGFYGNTTLYVSTCSLTVGAWQYIAVTVDGPTGRLRFYKNGTLVQQRTGSIGALIDGPVRIGSSAYRSKGVDGVMDEVRVSRREVDSAEIAQNFRRAAGTYYWKVTANDGTNPVVESSIRTFTINPAIPPAIPTLISPANLAVITDNRPTFDWSATAGGGGTYTLEYATDAGFTTGLVTVSGLTTNTHTVAGALSDATYYWHVKAIDATLVESGYQTIPFSFTVSVPSETDPPLITLDFPFDGEVTPDPFMLLGATVSDASPPMTVWIYGDDQADPTTLLHVETNVADLGAVTFDWDASVLQPESPYTMGLWHFDENTGTTSADGSGNGNGGTLVGPPSWSSDGRFGYALDFDGTSDYVTVPHAASLDVDSATGALTMEAWVYPRAAGGDNVWRTIASKSNMGNASQVNYRMSLDRTTGNLLFYSGRWPEIWISSVNVPENEWSYVALSLDAVEGKLRFYRNGVVLDSTAAGSAWFGPAFTSTLNIGVSFSLVEPFDGLIDEVRLTNRVLSTAEIAANYQLSDGVYYWKVTASDSFDNTGSAGPRSFTIGLMPPEVPTLLLPPDLAVLNDDTPTFVWSGTAGAGGTYTLQHATNAGFTTDLVTVPGLGDTIYTVGGALADNTYYWRVQAKNSGGDSSGYQTPFSFTVSTSVPAVPTLINPSDAAQINDDTPTFDWSATAGPGGSYTLQYALDAGLTIGLVTVAGLAETTYTVPPLLGGQGLPDNTYYWRVQAKNSVGDSSGYQTPFSFTVDTEAPAPPTLINPPNLAVISDNTPTFDWSATAGPGGTYTLQYATDPAFTFVVTVAGLADTTYDVTTALMERDYYWHVKATDLAGNEGGYQTAPFRFTCDLNPVGIPILIAPRDSSFTTDLTPTFVWSNPTQAMIAAPAGYEGVGRVAAVSYRLQYGSDPTFSQATTVAGVAETTYTLTTPLEDATCYWRVETVDEVGNHSGYQAKPFRLGVFKAGDQNVDGVVTSADVIYLVNYVFKGGQVPNPCAAAGDVNCDGVVTSADIIYMVNYVFKGGSHPCDIGALIENGTWNCP